jgi:hypothetical protein
MNKRYDILKIIFITLFLSLVFDLFLGKNLYKKFIRKNFKDVGSSYAIPSDIFHHNFKKNFKGLAGWGNVNYDFCTDGNGFRDSCLNQFSDTKEFDIAFIGDSFTEASGVNYEDSFIGLISSNFKNKKIANLGISSYSPTIYYAKINYLLNAGYQFKEIIVFIDLSDLIDDTACYTLKGNKVIQRKTFPSCFRNNSIKKNMISNFFTSNFYLMSHFYNFIKSKVVKYKVPQEIINHSRSDWTYNYKKENHNNYEYEESIKIIKQNMLKLSELLRTKNIDLSIAVYPWPNTLKNDTENNKQAKLWKEFCIVNCKNFYNFMTIFFKEVKKTNFTEVYRKYYIQDDIHMNIEGHKAISNFFINNYIE